MFSQVCVILFTTGLMATRSLLILVTALLVRILLECFLVIFLLRKDGNTHVDIFDKKAFK